MALDYDAFRRPKGGLGANVHRGADPATPNQRPCGIDAACRQNDVRWRRHLFGLKSCRWRNAIMSCDLAGELVRSAKHLPGRNDGTAVDSLDDHGGVDRPQRWVAPGPAITDSSADAVEILRQRIAWLRRPRLAIDEDCNRTHAFEGGRERFFHIDRAGQGRCERR